MKHIAKIGFWSLVLIFNLSQVLNAQTSWNLINNSSTPNSPYDYNVKKSIEHNGKLYLYGDTSGLGNTPYFGSFDPQNNTITQINFTPISTDLKIRTAAAINTTTTGTTYIFLGAESQSAQYPGIYRYDVQVGNIVADTIDYGMNMYHGGIDNICFFNKSGATSHDSLVIFAKYFGGTNVFKKHYDQTGYLSVGSFSFTEVYESIVYRDTLYVLGSDGNGIRLLKSSDSRNYTECSGFTNLWMSTSGVSYGFDMDTLNNSLYILLGDNESFSNVFKTSDGSSFSEVRTGGYFTRYVSLKPYKNKMWMNGRSMSFSASNANLKVSYLNSLGNDSTSVDTLGFIENNGAQYHLSVLNDSLYCIGNYYYFDGIDEYQGTMVYKLSPPVADVTYNNNLVCLNSLLTFTSTSTNADSTSWLYDGVFVAMSPGQNGWYSFNNPAVGNHVVSLVAHGAGITDTISIGISVYEVLASVAGSTLACDGVPLDLFASELGGYAPINYQWYQSGVTIGADTTALDITPAPGTYAYNAVVTDVHGCIGYSDTLIVQVNASKNIFGLVTTGTLTPLPVAGKVVLYKYEPFLTQFDSIDFKTIDAAGGYTFTSFTAGNYIIKAIPDDLTTLQITYGTSFVSWQNATTIQHGCEFDENKDIDVKPFINIGLGTGTGFMSGQITIADGFGQKPGGAFKPTAPGNPIGGIVVKGGRNPGGQMFTQTVTDVDGKYILTGLPDNIPGNEHYFIQVDIPGLDTNQTYHRHLISGNNQFANLDFTVDSMHVNPINLNNVGINDLNVQEHQLSVYPNPTSNQVNINYNLINTSSVSIELLDMVGRSVKILLPLTTQTANNYKNTFQLNTLNSGMYFIKLKINDKESIIKLCLNN